MKKLAFAAALMMMCSAAALPAFAADDNRNAVITTSVDPAYIVTIPSNLDVELNALNTDFGALALESAHLAPNSAVRITLISDYTLNHVEDDSKVIPYAINTGTANQVGAKFVSADFTTAGQSVDLTVSITQDDWNHAFAGDYKDTVTFQIEYLSK